MTLTEVVGERSRPSAAHDADDAGGKSGDSGAFSIAPVSQRETDEPHSDGRRRRKGLLFFCCCGRGGCPGVLAEGREDARVNAEVDRRHWNFAIERERVFFFFFASHPNSFTFFFLFRGKKQQRRKLLFCFFFPTNSKALHSFYIFSRSDNVISEYLFIYKN